MTSKKFREMSLRDFENGAVLDETYAALKYGERMWTIVTALAEKYETTGHPCCPLCGNCTDEPPNHDSTCRFGTFLDDRAKSRKEKHK